MKILLLLFVTVIYVILGIVCQEYKFIVQHGFWALYGAVFGVLLSPIVTRK